MEFVNYFPLRLKEERIRLGLSQDETAGLCGVSREMWGRYERGSGEPASSKLMAFSAAGADLAFIFSGIRAESTLSNEESVLLNHYRAAPEAIKKAALGVLLSVQQPDAQVTQMGNIQNNHTSGNEQNNYAAPRGRTSFKKRS